MIWTTTRVKHKKKGKWYDVKIKIAQKWGLQLSLTDQSMQALQVICMQDPSHNWIW